jgi:hypothetical protein
MDKITELITQELANANAKFPPFHSCHEGYSVLKEEIEELEYELTLIKNRFENLWESIKRNDKSNIKY